MPSGSVSAFAARKARQQQAQKASAQKTEREVEPPIEPPSKRLRRSTEAEETKGSQVAETNGPRTRSKGMQDGSTVARTVKGPRKASSKSPKSELVLRASEPQEEFEESAEAETQATEGMGEMSEDEVASVVGDADGYESPTHAQVELQNFPLSKVRLNKSNIVYGDGNTLCVRIKEKTVCVLIRKHEEIC